MGCSTLKDKAPDMLSVYIYFGNSPEDDVDLHRFIHPLSYMPPLPHLLIGCTHLQVGHPELAAQSGAMKSEKVYVFKHPQDLSLSVLQAVLKLD